MKKRRPNQEVEQEITEECGKDVFRRVPEILFETKGDAVERVLTGVV